MLVPLSYVDIASFVCEYYIFQIENADFITKMWPISTLKIVAEFRIAVEDIPLNWTLPVIIIMNSTL